MEQKERLVSLDVFRGITIAGMILVNNPGSWGAIYPALGHAKWHGVTPTDLIFPFFLFIVGVAITLSLTKRKESGLDMNKLILQVVKRGVLIFLVGVLMAALPFFSLHDGFKWIDFSTLRIPGVLQRIGIVYIVASIIFLKTNIKTQAVIGIALLFIYWFLMTVVPVPGVGPASLEPSTNLGAWLDRIVFGDHLWRSSKTWDPEGLLSTVPAISTALSGVMLGHWLRTKNDPATKTVWMFVAGNIAMVISMFWDMVFPINKGIWTSSYVLYAGGLASIFFAMCYWIVDVKGIKWWTKPFIVYGMNAIAVFFLSGVVAKLMGMIPAYYNEEGKIVSIKAFMYDSFFVPYFSELNASLAWALFYVLIWLGIMWIFYWKKVFIKI